MEHSTCSAVGFEIMQYSAAEKKKGKQGESSIFRGTLMNLLSPDFFSSGCALE